MARLHDFGHAPLFGAFALVVFAMLPQPDTWRRYLIAFVIAVACGAAVEVVQALIGRDAEWRDLATDAAGATSALLFLAARRQDSWVGRRARTRLLAGALACAVLLLAAAPLLHAIAAQLLRQHRFPVLIQADTALDAYYLSGRGNRILRRPLPDRWRRPGDTQAFWLELQPVAWSGIAQLEPAPDWRGYQTLVMSLVNPSAEPLELTLRIHDARHDQSYTDRFNHSFQLPPEARMEFRAPLADIAAAPQGRTLDLANIAGVMLFVADPGARPREMYLAGSWLE